MKSMLSAVLLLLASSAAFADGWTADFNITNLYVASQNNFQYRVYGMAPVASCTNGTNWAYLNDSDGGAAGYYAAILIAYTTFPAAETPTTTPLLVHRQEKTTGLMVFAVGDGNWTNGNPYSGGGSEALIGLDLKG